MSLSHDHEYGVLERAMIRDIKTATESALTADEMVAFEPHADAQDGTDGFVLFPGVGADASRPYAIRIVRQLRETVRAGQRCIWLQLDGQDQLGTRWQVAHDKYAPEGYSE